MRSLGIYIIFDNVAKSIVGGAQIHMHDAPAVRLFSDLAADQGTNISKHPADYDLWKVGVLDEATLAMETAGPQKVLSGQAWAASRDDGNGGGGDRS